MNKAVFTATLMMSLFFQVTSYAEDVKGNGGDMCENRFNTIRNDISNWISRGGPKNLSLQNISVEQYSLTMVEQIRSAKVSCTENKISIGSAEKTCRNYADTDGTPRIECNVKRFMATGESDQYVLVHHEYAGLAELEFNDGEESNYSLSNQISAFLETQTIKRLAINPVRRSKNSNSWSYDPPGRAIICRGGFAAKSRAESAASSQAKQEVTWHCDSSGGKLRNVRTAKVCQEWNNQQCCQVDVKATCVVERSY